MPRLALASLAALLLAAACGGPAETQDPNSSQPTSTGASTSGSTAGGPSSSVGDLPTESSVAPAPGEERVRPEGPDAPDFVLALGEGGSFSLSGEHKPVYMVFWAEW